MYEHHQQRQSVAAAVLEIYTVKRMMTQGEGLVTSSHPQMTTPT